MGRLRQNRKKGTSKKIPTWGIGSELERGGTENGKKKSKGGVALLGEKP